MDGTKSKFLISILWVSFAVSTSAAMIIWFIEPGIIDQITTKNTMLTEELNELNKLFFAAWWILPLEHRLFLTHTVKYPLNKHANSILGIICAFSTVFYFFHHRANGWFTYANLLILVFMFCISTLITWYAWNLPRDDVRG